MTPLTLRTALRQGAKLLEEANVSVPKLTAEVLLCHAIGKEKVHLYAHPEAPLSDVQRIHFGRYLHERISGKPTQYITHTQEFYGRDFHVTEAVLIPRPETEHLVETALRLVPRARQAVDIGCGSGAIGISYHLESQGSPVALCDLSLPALNVASRNARTLNAQVSFHQADFGSALRRESVDLILCNPPYIPSGDEANLQKEVRDFEPSLALYGGESGVEPYAIVINQAIRALARNGWLIFELGYQGLDAVRAMLDDSTWTQVEVVHDLAGWPRVLAARVLPHRP